MSFSKIINDTISISARYWWLWIFGFFISASEGGSWAGQVAEKIDVNHVRWGHSGFEEFLPALALGLVMIVLLAMVVYLILMIIAEASLIVGVRNIRTGQLANFSSSLSEGVKYFWRILGLWFTNVVVVLASVIFAAVPIVIGFVIHWVFGVLALLMVIPLWIAFVFAVTVVFAWAYRIGVIENRGYIDALGEGWLLLRRNVGKCIAVGLIAIFSQIVFGIASLALILIIGVPFLVAGMVNLWLGLIPGALVALSLFVVIYGFTGTYASTLWTVSYLELKRLAMPVEPATASA